MPIDISLLSTHALLDYYNGGFGFPSRVCSTGIFSFQFGVAEVVGVIGTVIVLWKAVTDLFKENIFEYSGVYKKNEIRTTLE